MSKDLVLEKVFDKATNSLRVLLLSRGSMIKARTVPGSSFSGNPKKYSVAFDTPFLSSNYIILICSTDGRTYTYQSKTTAGFVIDSNASSVIAGEVSWIAISAGETS